MKNKYNILYNNQEFIASEYQCAIFKNIEHGTGNLIVNAAAGSSKTTTIVNSLRFIPEVKRVLFVAFNKDIVKKIKENVSHSNTTILTFHSLGYYILLENNIIKNITSSPINENKYNNYVRLNFNNLTSNSNNTVIKKNYTQFINNILKLINYSRYYLAFTEKEIRKVSELYGVNTLDNECEICRCVLQWGKNNLNEIDYTDLLWLPNILNLTTKKYVFNWIFVDEAQDTNIAEQEIVKKCFKRGTRFCVVCDNFQQINVWAGSTLQAIENFKQFPNTKEYKLPISYRCSKKVVELAKQYSNNIIASENAIDGEILYDVPYTKPISNDMVLCRMTAPLIQLFFKYIKLNKKCYIRGFENIKENYIQIIKNSKTTVIDKQCLTSNGLFPYLYKQFIKQINDTQQRLNLTFEEVIEESSILSEYDTIEGLKILSEGLLITDELINKIETIFSDANNEGIILSTIHKAKGLESDNVFILYPSLLEGRKNQKDWEIETEKNLIYVAYTRAKKTLNFIKEDRTNRFILRNDEVKKQIKNEIYDISEKLKFNVDNNIKIVNQGGDELKKISFVIEQQKNIKKKKKPLSKIKIY